jgi:hypothetical protein
MADYPLQSYALALLNLMARQENAIDNLPLGTARCIRAQTSTLDVPARKLLQAVIQYSPCPEKMARQFLVALEKCFVRVKNSGDARLFLFSDLC